MSRIRITPEYDKEQTKLLKLVKQKGILVEVKPINTSLLGSDIVSRYKKSLGAVAKYNIWGKKITHIYDVYMDFDGSIKYYDYPYK